MNPMTLPPMRTRPALAIAEETESARLALYGLLPGLPPETFTTGDVNSEDNIRGIVCHVTFAIFSYACWIARVLGRLDLEFEKEEKVAFLKHVQSRSSAEEFEAASRRASERYYAVLAEIRPDELEKEFQSNWGATMGVEGMLEHALVHLMRHRRQIEIQLGKRPSAPLRKD